MSEKKLSLYDVVTKLAGPIMPVGETHCDEARLDNLKALTQLVDKLVSDIDSVSSVRSQHQFSMSRAGKYAHDFLTNNLGIPE